MGGTRPRAWGPRGLRSARGGLCPRGCFARLGWAHGAAARLLQFCSWGRRETPGRSAPGVQMGGPTAILLLVPFLGLFLAAGSSAPLGAAHQQDAI